MNFTISNSDNEEQSDNNNNNNNNNNNESDKEKSNSIRRRLKSVVTIDSSGVLQIPIYRTIPRQQSKLLSYCWGQNWNQVMVRCSSHLEETCHVTSHTRRTALHLATFNHACPLRVAQALLNANRHMVLVQDSHWYTPLHNVAFFVGESLVKVLCDTAIMVEQEVDDKSKLPPKSGTSPLFLAAKRGAPLRTLRQLLETRGRTEWIAPSTGSEPYWMESLDEYSSPLEVLLRDRADAAWHLPSASFISSSSTTTTNTTTSSSPSTCPSGRSLDVDKDGTKGRNTILHPRLLWQMKLIANERLRVYRGVKRTAKDSDDTVVVEENNDDDDDDEDWKDTGTFPSVDDLDVVTTEQEMQALSLWSKCIELLAEHVPRLLLVKDGEDYFSSFRGGGKPRYSRGRFGVVHCVSSAKVPLPSLLHVALMVYPEQALQRDEYGMLPLHHALTAHHPYATKTLVSMLLHHAPQMALVSCPPMSLSSLPPSSSSPSSLVPPANATITTTTTTTTTSTLPIGLALEKGLTLEVLKELLWAESDVSLNMKDSRTGLYPFALAASKDYDLDVIYTLLNGHPQVLNQQLL